MQVFEMETDETMQSVLEYGTPEFPFAYYYDEINRYHEKSVAWHWHNGLELSFVIAGPVECYAAEEKAELKSGDALFINQGALHRFVSHSGAVVVNYIFSPEFIAPLGSRIHTNYVLPVLLSSASMKKIGGGDAQGQEVLKELVRMHSELEIQAKGWEMRIKSCILNAWDKLYPMLPAGISAGQGRRAGSERRMCIRIRKMLNYVHRHYAEEVSLEKIAAATGISKSEALRCFKSGLQTTPMAYLTQYRLSCSKEMLQKGEGTVQEIAIKCGFDNSSYFCKVFKKYLGISPLEFCKLYADESAGA